MFDAERDLAVDRFDRAADAEAGIRRVGGKRGPARLRDEGVGGVRLGGSVRSCIRS